MRELIFSSDAAYFTWVRPYDLFLTKTSLSLTYLYSGTTYDFACMILPQIPLFSGRDGIVSILDASFRASGLRGDPYDAIDDGLLIREV